MVISISKRGKKNSSVEIKNAAPYWNFWKKMMSSGTYYYFMRHKSNHDTSYYRKQSSSKGVKNDSSLSFDDNDAYIFKVSVHENELQSIESP